MTQINMFPELVKKSPTAHLLTDSQQFRLNQKSTADISKLPKQAKDLYKGFKTLNGETVTGFQIRQWLEQSDVIQTRQDKFRIFQYYTRQLEATGVIAKVR